jgi:hypothetical protein
MSRACKQIDGLFEDQFAMLLEYASAFLRAHGPRCAPAVGDAVVGGRDSFYRFNEPYDQGGELAL